VALRKLVVLAALCCVVLVGTVARGGAGTGATAKLLLDGVPVRPEIARTSDQRSRGLMHRTKAPTDGMLFVFPGDTTGSFWMKNTLVPLKIVFFDRRGKQVRTLRMSPCRRDPCPLYDPGRRYRFALELAGGDRRAAKRLGPQQALERLIRTAT
jgi:uncharacterized membrane protein (UPF0127 family)